MLARRRKFPVARGAITTPLYLGQARTRKPLAASRAGTASVTEAHALSLRSQPFLSASPRESMAGGDRVAGLRLSLPRLERADYGGVLRSEHGGPAAGREQ